MRFPTDCHGIIREAGTANVERITPILCMVVLEKLVGSQVYG